MNIKVAFTLALTAAFTGIVGNHAEAAKSKPDLIVSAVSAPSSASPGETIVVSGTIKNQGRASSNAFSVAAYLSASPSNTTGATFLGTQTVSSLAAGASVQLVGSLPMPGTTTNGTFYVVTVADSTKVISESNESNNTGASGAIAVKDLTPPTISSVTSSGTTATSASVTWTTDKSSSSQVEYGTTAAYGSATSLNTSLVTSHSAGLSSLVAGTVYHFRVRSKDAAGNEALSSDYTFATAASSAIEYYVSSTGNDAADGSAAHPWATIQHAADTVGPGSVVHVAPGNYLQAIISNTSGTATARIQFVSDTKWGAKIISTGAQYTWENHGDYLDIQDFDVTGDGRIGILNWASNVHVIGNHVHDIPATGCPSDGGAGVDHANYSAHDNDTIGNVVHDVGTLGCFAVQGIYHSNLRGHIVNNISFRNAGWGIHLYHAPMNVVVANNLSFANGKGGIVVGAPAGGTYIADGMRVVNNIVIDNGSYGIKEAEQTGLDNQYLNNLVYGNVDDDWYIQGSFATPPTNIVANPQFVNYQPDGTGNYHLALGSPAIDSGTSAGAPSDDFDGGPRPQGTGWDIGPYEWRP